MARTSAPTTAVMIVRMGTSFFSARRTPREAPRVRPLTEPERNGQNCLANPTKGPMRTGDQEMEAATAAAPVRLEPALESRIDERVTDGDLLLRIADGDTRAFEILYRRFARPVLGLALRLLRDRGRAEDAVQETFASIWRSAGSYRPERGPAAPWLYAVARNAIVDRLRARTEIPAEIPDTPADT